MSRSLLRYDRLDNESTPPLILHRVTVNMDVYARFNDRKWTYLNTNYLQKYQAELVTLGLRDFVRDYYLKSGGPDGVSVVLHRPVLTGTDYVVLFFPDSSHADFGGVKIDRAANAVTIYNSGEEELPFHFIVLEKLNQSV